MKDLPSLKLDEGPYEYPETERLHKEIVQRAIEESKDVCIITPTLRPEYLDFHILAARFQEMESLTPVFVITPNTSVRDRYEQLRNGLHYSTAKWPLSTVKADGSLAERTTHVRSGDAPPGVIFTRYSTRLPNDSISQRICLVLYDDGVKFEEERWEKFQTWRERNDIPGVVYFVRDPLGEVYQRVKGDVDGIWAWTPSAIQEIRSTALQQKTNRINDGNVLPTCTRREQDYLQIKSAGQSHNLHLCSDSPVVDAFDDLWEAFEDLQDAADRIEVSDVYDVTAATLSAVSGFSRLLADLQYSDNYRAEHGNAVSLSGRVFQVEQLKENLVGEGAAARTHVEHVHQELSNLQETIVDGEASWWKRGAVVTAIQKVMDQNKSLIIVAPDGPAQNALRADLQIEREKFFSQARPFVSLHTPSSLPQADPADYLLLYGPPKYEHRWLLRAPTASEVGVLAYPHELGLLHSQVADLNQEMLGATPLTQDSSYDTYSVVGSILSDFESVRKAIEETTTPSGPTDCGTLDGVSIDIPHPEEIETKGQESDTGFDGYTLVETDPDETIDDIIKDTVPNFSETDASFTPSSTEGSPETTNKTESSKISAPTIEDCIDVRTKSTSGNGQRAIALRPSDTLEVVNPDAGTTVEKPATAIQPGEKVVAVADRDAIRDKVEEILLDSGYIDTVGYARMWKHQLQTEITRHDDDLDEFKKRVEEEGIDKYRSTYRNWYNGDIRLPKAKKSLSALAKAYEIEEVLDEFENVWKANHKIRKIKNNLIDLLKKRAQDVVSETGDEDVVLDDELDIRLSDFETTDEEGNKYVEVRLVTDTVGEYSVSESYLRRWRNI